MCITAPSRAEGPRVHPVCSHRVVQISKNNIALLYEGDDDEDAMLIFLDILEIWTAPEATTKICFFCSTTSIADNDDDDNNFSV